MSITIRQATTNDVDLLVPLYSGYRVFYKQEPEPEREKAFLQDRLAKRESVIFIAVDAVTGTGVGFTQLYPMFSSVRMKTIWILNDLFVSDSARGQGVAANLMNRAEQYSRESDSAGLELATGKDNHPAQALYEKRGWSKENDFFHYSLNN